MRIEKYKNRKRKAMGNLDGIDAKEETKKLFSNQVMQMQSLYGNRAVTRTMRRIYGQPIRKKFGEINVANAPEERMLTPEVVPIYRWWDGEATGLRVYLKRNQFHYNHKLRMEKERDGESLRGARNVGEAESPYDMNKRQERNNGEKVDRLHEKKKSTVSHNEGEEMVADGVRDRFRERLASGTERGGRANILPFWRRTEDDEKSKAKQYFSTKLRTRKGNEDEKEAVNLETEHENIENDKFSKILKYGRFSFLSAYPYILLALRRRKKDKEKDEKKKRKKSTFTRFRRRFSREE